VGESLRANLDVLELSRQLATIHCQVELETGPRGLQPGPADVGKLRDGYTRLEFTRWLRELENGASATGAAERSDAGQSTPTRYETILTEARLDAWLTRLEAATQFAFDTETTSLNYMAARIVGVSFAVTAGEAAYIPLAHDYPGAPEQLERESVLARLRPLLENPDRNKIGHHLKYDRNVLANHDINMAGMRFDSMLESYVLDSTATRHDMDSVALKYLGHSNIKYEDVAG
jgi:DNA polymerase-1